MDRKTRFRALTALSALGVVAVAGYFYWSPLGPVKSVAVLVGFVAFMTLSYVMDDTF